MTPQLLTWLNWNEGMYYEKIGKFESAIEYYLLAEKCLIIGDYKYYLSVLYGRLAKSYEMKGEFKEALAIYQKEMDIAFDMEEEHRISRSIHNIAGFLWKNGKLEQDRGTLRPYGGLNTSDGY